MTLNPPSLRTLKFDIKHFENGDSYDNGVNWSRTAIQPANFHLPHGLQWRSACSCKIMSRSVEWLQSYCKFSIFNVAAVRHLGFVKYANFHSPHGFRSQSACFCKITWQSLERFRSCCKILISYMAAVRLLGCLKYANSHLPHGLRYLRVLTKFCPDRLNGCWVIASFRFPIWRPPAIMDFQNMHIFTFHTVWGHDRRVHAKFRRHRLNSCGVIARFWFPIWRPSAILDFQNMQIFTFRTLYGHDLLVRAKFCRDRMVYGLFTGGQFTGGLFTGD